MGLISEKQADELVKRIGTKSGQLSESEMYDPFTATHWIDISFVHKIIRDCVYAPPVEPKQPHWGMHEEPESNPLEDVVGINTDGTNVVKPSEKPSDWFQRMEKMMATLEKSVAKSIGQVEDQLNIKLEDSSIWCASIGSRVDILEKKLDGLVCMLMEKLK